MTVPEHRDHPRLSGPSSLHSAEPYENMLQDISFDFWLIFALFLPRDFTMTHTSNTRHSINEAFNLSNYFSELRWILSSLIISL